MKKTLLQDSTEIYCIHKSEAKMLDHHVDGYLKHGITVSDNDVIFDVGANIGVFSVRVVQKASAVKVVAFEPIPAIFSALEANAINTKSGSIIPIRKGVSDQESTAVFTYFPNTPALSTLHPQQWDDNPGAFKEAVKGTMRNPPKNMWWMRLIPTMFAGMIANHLVKGKEKVQCDLTTVSTVIDEQGIQKLDLLKIDCEGAEWNVLKGIREDHWPIIKSAVIEVHDIDGRLSEVKQLLSANGFNKIIVEREQGLEDTLLSNVFAVRS